MARLHLNDLPPRQRQAIQKQYGLPTRKTGSGSPYADLLGNALDRHFPDRVVREFRPIPGRRFRIDFAFPDALVGIEFDGYRHHGFSQKGFREGLIRQNLLVLHGWRLLRYSLTDVRDRLEAVLAEVQAAVDSKKSLP